LHCCNRQKGAGLHSGPAHTAPAQAFTLGSVRGHVELTENHAIILKEHKAASLTAHVRTLASAYAAMSDASHNLTSFVLE
jgi:hypothetical protein